MESLIKLWFNRKTKLSQQQIASTQLATAKVANKVANDTLIATLQEFLNDNKRHIEVNGERLK